MKVCFITPPSPFLLDERVFPSLGILKVAAAASIKHEVEHLDLNGVENYEDATASHCSQSDVDVFALTATTPQMVSATRITKTIRQVKPEVKIIIGGPHPTLVHAAFMTTENTRSAKAMTDLTSRYDVIVAGDGEFAILEALETNAPSVINADDPKSPLFLSGKSLEQYPARHLIDIDSYHYQMDGIRVTPIIGQLGCPFGCNFCAGRDSPMLRRVRLRSTAHVIAEMQHIYETYGIRGFMFFDDELNVNRQMLDLMYEITRLQERLGVEFRCRGFVKAELFTEEQAAAMRNAGFRRILCGFESGSDRILKNINKNATKEDNTRAMEISHKYGLGMKALMSIGHPGESPDTIEDTMKWLLSVTPPDFDLTIITAYPGSPYYDRAHPVDRFGEVWEFETNNDKLFMFDIDYTEVEDFYKGGMDSYKSYVFTAALSCAEIVKLRDHAERTVRDTLGIPYYTAAAPIRFEASMGQLSGSIYRRQSDR